MDLSNLSTVELKKLAQDVERELVSRSKSEREAARNEILSIAQSVGIPLSELLESTGRKKSGAVAGRKVAVQYRNPNNASQEWSGRGRQPAWVKEWADQHQSIDGLKV